MRSGKTADRLDSLIAVARDDIQAGEPLEWVAGVNLIGGATTYVSFEAVALDRTQGGRFWQSSDGLASGNTFDEAALQRLLERIEWDAYVLWQVTSSEQRQACCIAAGSFNDPIVTDLTTRITTAGLRLCLFDITSDIGIACYSAPLGPADIVAMRQLRYPDVTHGSGAHPNPVRAAIRGYYRSRAITADLYQRCSRRHSSPAASRSRSRSKPSNGLQSIRLASLSQRRNCPVPGRF